MPAYSCAIHVRIAPRLSDRTGHDDVPDAGDACGAPGYRTSACDKPERTVRLDVRMTRSTSWGAVRPLVCAAAGLPTDTVLYHGVGPVEDRWHIGEPPLLTGCEVSTAPAAGHPHRPPLVLSVMSGPDAGRWVAIGARPLAIGRHRDADLQLTDPAVSRWHALIDPHPTGLVVTDTGSVNGVHVDGHTVGDPACDTSAGTPHRGGADTASTPGQAAIATTGSVVRVGGTVLQVQLTTEPPGGFRADGRGHLVRSGRRVWFHQRLPELSAPPMAPEPPARRSLPLVTALIGAAVGGVLALVMHNAMFLAFAALGPVMAIGSAVGDRVTGRRSYRRQRADHRAAVAAWQAAASTRARAEILARWRRWPGPDALARRASVASAQLWERSRADADYLHVAVGHGAALLDVAAAAPSPTSASPASEAADAFQPLTVRDVPVVLPLPQVPGGVVGFVGPVERRVARYAMAQLACHHSPADLALAAMGPRPDWESVRDLPHAVDADATDRRDLVVLLDGPTAFTAPAGAALLAAAADSLATGTESVAIGAGRRPRRVIALVLADTLEQLPLSAVPVDTALARAGTASVAPNGTMNVPNPTPRSAAPAVQPAAASLVGYTQVGPALFREICRALAPLRDSATEAGGIDAPTRSSEGPSITLADLGDAVPPLTAAGVRERWSRPSARAVLGLSMAASDIGPARSAPSAAASDAMAAVDLDADGPHLLIAGTTGAGKSELLQTLITSWALAAPPTATTFLLVDYKGGAAFGPIRGLPHVVGMLTDLDPATSARALASLRAELRRREHEQNTGSAPAPKLVLVIDEFATLAAELPDFLTGVLDIAQRGRSLGLHLVLATQRPAGVVSPAMRANISARICLRVTDPADSLDVVGVPDAARIHPDSPGRAILRTGNGVTTFQTALVTVPVAPDIVVSGGPAGTVTSRRLDAVADRAIGPDVAIVATAVEAAVEAAACLPQPRRPWLEPLPTRIPSSPERPSLLARADRPDQQIQQDMAAPDSSTLIVGPPGSGRSTALRRIAEVAAHRGEELLVVDGAGALADLDTWPQVSSYLTVREPALVLRMLSLLADPTHHPADGRRRHLLVDQYDLVAAELERADYLLGSSLLGEVAARTNRSVLISATGPERLVQQRVAAAFTEVIVLGSATPERTHSPLDARAAPTPGRGCWRGVEVQVVDAPARPGAPLPAPWPDPLVVRPLPTVVAASELPHGDAEHVVIGIGGDGAEPCAVDLTREGGGIVIAGPRRSGVTTTLELLAAQAAKAGIPVLRALTRTCRRTCGAASTHVVDVPCQESPEPLRTALAAHEGPVLVIADHHGLGDDHPAAAVLERFLAVCGPGQHLAIGARPEVLARARRGHLYAAAAARRGLLLAPDKHDGALFDIALPQRRGPVPPGRGVLVWNGSPIPVQVALFSPTTATSDDPRPRRPKPSRSPHLTCAPSPGRGDEHSHFRL